MKLIIFAFILSLTFHILLFLPFSEKKVKINNIQKIDKPINRSNIKYVRLEKKLATKKRTEKIIEKKSKAKIIQKSKDVYKKVNKKDIKPQKKKIKKSKQIKTKKSKTKEITSKPVKKLELSQNFTKKVIIKPQRKRETIKKRSLENFFLKEPVPLDKELLDDITNSYIKLYGNEFKTFTKVQKVFLQKNLKNIGKITKKYLRYPHIAKRTKQQGMNIVEFILHPNGDISKLRLSKLSGYSSLDKNTINTVEIAFKDYPRPKTNTKVKIYVYYKLY